MPHVDLPERFNIDERFLGRRVAAGEGGREALRLDGGSLTYEEVDDLARRYGVALRELGVQPEQRVLLALPDGADYVGALFGILRIGAVGVMVNPGLGADAMTTMIERSRAPIAVVHVDRVEAMAEATGLPKAVPQTHRSFANTTALCTAAVGYRPDDVTMAVPKLFFGYAAGASLFFPFSVGAASVLFPERPTPEVLYERIERYRPTILVHVPSAINQMLGHPGAEEADLSGLRFAISAGEALPESLYHAWRRRFGVEILDGLGTAEMWHIFVTNLPGDVRPGTLGRALPGFDVRVRDEEGPVSPTVRSATCGCGATLGVSATGRTSMPPRRRSGGNGW